MLAPVLVQYFKRGSGLLHQFTRGREKEGREKEGVVSEEKQLGPIWVLTDEVFREGRDLRERKVRGEKVI